MATEWEKKKEEPGKETDVGKQGGELGKQGGRPEDMPKKEGGKEIPKTGE